VRPRWQRTTRRDVYTVDVTAFLSLMVILVPFLLVTAVFSRTTILELQPAGGERVQELAPDPLQLRVMVRQSVIEVSYLGLSQPVRINRSTDDSALASLATLDQSGDTQEFQSLTTKPTITANPLFWLMLSGWSVAGLMLLLLIIMLFRG
jgi:hypothetical protein